MTNKCQICDKIVNLDDKSHYYREHKVKIADYYQKYYNKVDLFTKEKLVFKAPESYLLNDFNDKLSLRKYIESLDENDIKLYLSELLKRRKELKGIVFAPSHIECKTILFPGITYLEKKFGSGFYNNIVELAGLKTRFNYSELPVYQSPLDLEIICDTREASPLSFDNLTIQKKEYADYSLVKNFNNTHIERKELSDYLNSVSGGYERLVKEFERAKQDDAYIVIVIESPLQHLLGFNHLKHIHSKASSDYIFHQTRSLNSLFPNGLQMLAVDGRKRAVDVIGKVLNMKNVRNLDLMFLYEKGMI